MKKTSVGIVDDHQVIAIGVTTMLNASGQFEVLFTVNESDQILSILDQQRPEVLVMDVVMPGSVSTDNFREVLKKYPDQKIVAFTALNSPAMIEMLLKMGVRGYVNKNQPLDSLKTAIEDVVYDRIYLPENYEFLRKKIKTSIPQDELSKREIEILQLIAMEKKTNEISELLQISVNTVETHRKHLFEKLGVSNLAGLVKVGYERGYLH